MFSSILAICYFLWIALLVIASLGGVVYLMLAIVCTGGLLARRKAVRLSAAERPPITLLKPLHGAEPELAACLQSFFTQAYPQFEILFAVRTNADPAVRIVEKLQQQYPHIPSKLILTGAPPYANAKVYSMQLMAEAAQHEILVITDSDTAVGTDFLNDVAATFDDPKVGAMTNLYRGEAGTEFWSQLEALGMSTEFMAGVVVAEKLEGMKFALGPAMAIRCQCLEDIGGFAAMRDYLADDFVLGHWAAEKGWQVALSTYVVNHYVSTTGFAPTFKHRLRWNRSTRFSRPAGYFGQGFTYAFSWALFLFISAPSFLTLQWLALVFGVRVLLALALGKQLLGDLQVRPRLWMLPLQDFLSFASWLGGWVSREIIWRGERYRLLADGKFSPVLPRSSSL